jgi:hypothetical protein
MRPAEPDRCAEERGDAVPAQVAFVVIERR